MVPPRKPRARCLLLEFVEVRVYLLAVAGGRLPKPDACPDCGHKRFHWNGGYSRSWVARDCVVIELRICRVRCCNCRIGWTLIPGFVLPRFRFSLCLIQWACWGMVAGNSSVRLRERLMERLSPIVADHGMARIPAESTLRWWMRWLNQGYLQRYVRLTLSFVAQIDAELAVRAHRLIAVPRTVAPQLPVPRRSRARAGRVLRACMALAAAVKKTLFRRSPHQLRDWALWLFREHRRILCRPP